MDVKAFGDRLISNLGDDFFHYQSIEVLVYNMLKQISPVNKKLQMNNDSIEKACSIVVSHFGIAKVVIRKLDQPETNTITVDKESAIQKFCRIVANIETLPTHHYSNLSHLVHRDLGDITELINQYESKDCVKKFILKNEIPKSHEEKILVTFYKRCVVGRSEIINYQLYDLKRRVLSKSSPTARLFLGTIFNDRYDRPYHFAGYDARRYFDSQCIHLGPHRFEEFYQDEANDFEKLYDYNKGKFYIEYFKRHSKHQHFRDLLSYLKRLPLKNDRTRIFKELVRLFKSQRWISFYALALPQIEGLFSEMCTAINPDHDLSQQSLSRKVTSVRPHYSYDHSHLDYFEYHIPRLRNKFAHTGYDENLKLKCYDLIVDLRWLLRIFYELENPWVQIKKIHDNREPEDFKTIANLISYLRLLDALKPSQRENIKERISEFEKNFLAPTCAKHLIDGLSAVVDEKVGTLSDQVNHKLLSFSPTVEFHKLYKMQLEELLLHNESFRERIINTFSYRDDDFRLFDDIMYLLDKHRKHLPSLTAEYSQILLQIRNKNLKLLQNLCDTWKICKTFDSE
jgi:hypothetical protein